MELKFNGGRGALLCSQCRIIMDEDFCGAEWKALTNLSYTEDDWFCNKCCPVSFKEQQETMLKALVIAFKEEEITKAPDSIFYGHLDE